MLSLSVTQRTTHVLYCDTPWVILEHQYQKIGDLTDWPRDETGPRLRLASG